MTKIRLTIDLDKIVRTVEARRAWEKFFARGVPDEDALKKLKYNDEDIDASLAYLVKKTMLEDDGTMRAVELFARDGTPISHPLSKEEIRSGKPATTAQGEK